MAKARSGGNAAKGGGNAAKWIVSIVLVVLVVGALVLSYFTNWYRDWSAFVPKKAEAAEVYREGPKVEDDEEGERGIAMISEEIDVSRYALLSLDPKETERAFEIQVVSDPDTSSVFEYEWKTEWDPVDSSYNSTWVEGKEVSDYVEVRVHEEDSTKATLVCKKAFASEILAVVGRVGTDYRARGECRVDYCAKIVSVGFQYHTTVSAGNPGYELGFTDYDFYSERDTEAINEIQFPREQTLMTKSVGVFSYYMITVECSEGTVAPQNVTAEMDIKTTEGFSQNLKKLGITDAVTEWSPVFCADGKNIFSNFSSQFEKYKGDFKLTEIAESNPFYGALENNGANRAPYVSSFYAVQCPSLWTVHKDQADNNFIPCETNEKFGLYALAAQMTEGAHIEVRAVIKDESGQELGQGSRAYRFSDASIAFDPQLSVQPDHVQF